MTGRVCINVKNQELEDCMTNVDECGMTRLSNRITHFWSEEITNTKESAADKGHGFEDNNGSVNHEMNLIVAQNEAMSSIVVNDESVNPGDKENESTNAPHEFCTKNPWTRGIAKM
jgi:hypothetical protein